MGELFFIQISQNQNIFSSLVSIELRSEGFFETFLAFSFFCISHHMY